MPSLYRAELRHAQYYEAQLKTAQGHGGIRQGAQLFEQEQQRILLALAWVGCQAADDDEAAIKQVKPKH